MGSGGAKNDINKSNILNILSIVAFTLIPKILLISTRIGTAREMGDLKENADYHAASKGQELNLG